jgi:hypothetical protein
MNIRMWFTWRASYDIIVRRQPLDENAGLAKENNRICDACSLRRVTQKRKAFVQYVAAIVKRVVKIEDHWVWDAIGNFAEGKPIVMGLEAEACA